MRELRQTEKLAEMRYPRRTKAHKMWPQKYWQTTEREKEEREREADRQRGREKAQQQNTIATGWQQHQQQQRKKNKDKVNACWPIFNATKMLMNRRAKESDEKQINKQTIREQASQERNESSWMRNGNGNTHTHTHNLHTPLPLTEPSTSTSVEYSAGSPIWHSEQSSTKRWIRHSLVPILGIR